MYDEPDIVKMLRGAEKLGKLQSSLPIPSEEFEVQETIPEKAPEDSVDFTRDSVNTNTMDKDVSSSIAEKEKIAVALKESEERYKALFNSSFELIYLHDFKGNFIDANPVAFKLLGYNKAELGSLNFSSLLDKGQFWKAIKTIKEIKKYGRQKEPTEFRLKTKNGTFIDIETTAEMVYRNGKPYAVQGIAHDITERKKAEQSIKESEEKYRRLFDSSPDIICETDDKGNILAANSNMIKSMGVPPEKLIGKNIFDILPREIAEQRAKIARKAFEEMKNLECDDERTGRHFHSIYVPIVYPDGKKTIQLIARDTTDQKKAERALCNSEEKLRSIVENSSDQIFMLDKDCKFLSINKTAADLSRKSPQETIGMSISEIFPENIAVQFSKNIKNVFDTGKSMFIEEKMVVQDRELYNSTSLNPVKNDSGRVIAVTGIVRDITERKKAEKAVIESEEKLRRILDSSPDAITVTDLNGNIIECNQATSMIHGFKKKELIGKNAFELFSPKDLERAKEGLKKTLELESVKNLEYTLVTKDGREFPAELSACIIRDASGNPLSFVAITKDITERKKAQEHIKKQNEFVEMVINSLQYSLYVIDKDYNIVLSNKAAKEKGIVDGGRCYQLTHHSQEPCSDEHICPLKEVFRTGNSIVTEHIHFDNDGNSRNFDVHGDPIFDKDGQVIRMIEYSIDITERKQAEESLKESEEKYRNVVERANDGIVIIQGMIIKYVNPRSFGVLGYDPTEMIGTSMTNYIHPDELPKVVEYYKRRIAGEDVPSAYESAFVHKDGRRIDVELSGGVITYQGKTADMIMIHDVTERKKAEKNLKEKIEELERYKKLTVDRELKMMELKEQIKKLEEKSMKR